MANVCHESIRRLSRWRQGLAASFPFAISPGCRVFPAVLVILPDTTLDTRTPTGCGKDNAESEPSITPGHSSFMIS